MKHRYKVCKEDEKRHKTIRREAQKNLKKIQKDSESEKT